MKIIDNFELEGGVAIPDYAALCQDVCCGDVLEGAVCTEGMSFSKNGVILGYLLGDECILPSYACGNGYRVYARITGIRKTGNYPILFASLHVTQKDVDWGIEADNE